MFCAVQANASVALLLEMPYGQFGAFNPTGHAALYFDHICAASPLKLRPCQPGELGAVISRYNGVGNADWVAVPLIPYLYAVDTAAQVPDTIDKLTALRLRDLYRRQHLTEVAPDTPDGGMPDGNWYQLTGSAFDRTIYGFQLRTTADQDQELIEEFNDRPNVTRFQGVYRNCADFTRVVLNQLFPHAIHRNYIADFGATTPKSVARGVVHYGRKHPTSDLQMFRIPQLAGTTPRSMSIQGITGSLITRYGVPLAFFAPHVTAVVLVAYIGKGRFAVPKTAPVLDVAEMEARAAREAPVGSFVLTQAGRGSKPPASAQELTRQSSGGGVIEPVAFYADPTCDFCGTSPLLP